ncbi:hypothetical protein JCM8202v2_005230 [Rhodotorula sphaerocarpa]
MDAAEPAVFRLPAEVRTALLPPEQPGVLSAIIGQILSTCLALSNPEACAAFSQTCKYAYTQCQSSALWRQLHQAAWDDPRASSAEARANHTVGQTDERPYDYAQAVKKRRNAANRYRDRMATGKALEGAALERALDALLEVANDRPDGTGYSHNQKWLADLLRKSPEDAEGSEGIVTLLPFVGVQSGPGHFLRSSAISSPTMLLAGTAAAAAAAASGIVGPDPDTGTDSASFRNAMQTRGAELVAHLHALATPSPLAFVSPSIRTRAKEIVYTRANWTRSSLYGPFKADGSGRVDWRKVEALAIVAGANILDAGHMGWGQPPTPRRRDEGDATTRPHSAGPARADPAGRDWSGLTSHELVGTYMFLHYPVYLAFQSRRSLMLLGDEDEAVGDCMPMVLEVLPDGTWAPEVDQPDLSVEARMLDDDADDSSGDDDFQSASEDEDEDDFEGDSDSSMDDEALLREFRLAVQEASLASAVHGDQVLGDDAAPSAAEAVTGATERDRAAEEARSDADGLLTSDRPAPGAPSDQPGVSQQAPASALPHSAPHGNPPPRSPPQDLPSLRLRPPPGQMPHPTHPTLSFRGVPGQMAYSSTTGETPASTMKMSELYATAGRSFRGTVEWIPQDGVARVTIVVRYGGEDQWVLTGVQFGGPASQSGVIGVWTSADHSPESPTGPFWYWPHIRPE